MGDHDVLIPDGLHDGFDGLVAGADLSAAFVLNKYVNDQVDNESPAELGEPVHFKVEPIDQIPDFLDYFITGCDMEGLLDTGDAISHPLSQNVNCFYSHVEAYHTTPNDLTFNMFAFGESEQSLQSNRLNCQVRLCFNQDSEGSCYNQYVQQKEGCTGELYEAPETTVPYADHNTNLTDDETVEEAVVEAPEEAAEEIIEEVVEEVVEEVAEEIVESETLAEVDEEVTEDIIEEVVEEVAEEVVEEVTEDVAEESSESEVAQGLTQADDGVAELVDQLNAEAAE